MHLWLVSGKVNVDRKVKWPYEIKKVWLVFNFYLLLGLVIIQAHPKYTNIGPYWPGIGSFTGPLLNHYKRCNTGPFVSQCAKFNWARTVSSIQMIVLDQYGTSMGPCWDV